MRIIRGVVPGAFRLARLQVTCPQALLAPIAIGSLLCQLGTNFAHNHPTGDPTPSKSDKQLTRDLVFIGNMLQIKVLDHIIIGENTYFSFADEGLIQKYEDNFLNMKIRGVSDIGVKYVKTLPAVFTPLLPAIYLTEEAVVRFL